MKLKISKNIYQSIYKYLDYIRYYGIFNSITRLPNYLLEKAWNVLIDYPASKLIGSKQTKKLYFNLFKLRCEYGLFLGKKRLWIGNYTMQRVYKIVYVDIKKIKYRTDQKGSPFFIESGKWDKNKRKIPLHPTIKQLFVNHYDYKETQQYKNMKKAVLKGEYNKSYWCRTLKEVDKYFEILISAYDSIKKKGYKTQLQLKKINKKGTTIIVASHDLSEIETVSTRIGILANKTLNHIGTIEELKKKISRGQEVHFESYPGNYEELAKNLKDPLIIEIENRGNSLVIHTRKPDKILKKLLITLNKLDEHLLDVKITRLSLRDVFANITKKKNEDRKSN